MKIPSYKCCNNLWNQYHVPLSVRRHCETVTKVGVVLAGALQRAGVEIDVTLVEIGCRLHDTFKAVSLNDDDLACAGLTQEEIAQWAKVRAKYPEGTHETIVAAYELEPEYPDFSIPSQLVSPRGQ